MWKVTISVCLRSQGLGRGEKVSDQTRVVFPITSTDLTRSEIFHPYTFIQQKICIAQIHLLADNHVEQIEKGKTLCHALAFDSLISMECRLAGKPGHGLTVSLHIRLRTGGRSEKKTSSEVAFHG